MTMLATTVRHAVAATDANAEVITHCIVGICYSIGRLPLESDILALETLCLALQRFLALGSSQQNTVYASLAYLMKSLPSAPLAVVSTALLRAHALSVHTSSFERGMSLMYFYQYVTLLVMEESVVVARKPKTTWKIWSSAPADPMLDPVDALNVLVLSIGDLRSSAEADIGIRSMTLLALVGSLLGVEQYTSESAEKGRTVSKALLNVRKTLHRKVVLQLATDPVGLNVFSADPGEHIYAQAIVCTAAQVLSTMQEDELDRVAVDWQPLLSLVTDVILTYPEALFLGDGFLSEYGSDISSEGLAVSSPKARLDLKVGKDTQKPLYSSLGKISKVAGALLAMQWERGHYAEVVSVLDRISQFFEVLQDDWSSNNQAPTMTSDMSGSLWQYLKTALFVETVIAHAFSDALLYHEPPSRTHDNSDSWELYSRCSREAVRNVFATFSSLHFVTARFGLAGFPTWQTALQGLAEWIDRHDNQMSTAGGFANEVVRAVSPNYRGIYVHPSPLVKDKLIFYLTVSRLLLRRLSPDYVEHELLPRLYPYLTFNMAIRSYEPTVEDKDLFELAHASVVSLFESDGRHASLAASFAPWYSSVLIERFPVPIDFDLMRRSFTVMVRGLSTNSSRVSRRRPTKGFGDEEEDEDGEEGAPTRLLRNARKVIGESEELSTATTASRQRRHAVDRTQVNDDDDDPSTSGDVQAEEEGELVAWTCVARLADAIYRLSLDDPKTSPPLEDLTDSPGSTTSLASTERYTAILAASPPTAARIREGQLATVLFDQISTIALVGLPPLLTTIRHLLLGGPDAARYLGGLLTDEPDEDRAFTMPDIPGLGAETDPDRSLVWKSLFDTVAHYRGFDYTRREACAQWYLSVLEEARAAWKSRGQQKVPAVDDLAVPELRAKL
ncbi:hypothetical protein HKX48_007735 [Thoreauomyces humboldtii]|nr:hypothetical protein HKX48_007735 [Thoreauomyces humboldtii]